MEDVAGGLANSDRKRDIANDAGYHASAGVRHCSDETSNSGDGAVGDGEALQRKGAGELSEVVTTNDGYLESGVVVALPLSFGRCGVAQGHDRCESEDGGESQ